MGNGKIDILKDVFLNFFLNRKYGLSYVVENAEWSIKSVGKYLTESFNKSGLFKARITTTHQGLKNQIVHFGSLNTFLTTNGFKKSHRSNKNVATCFHIVPDDPRLKFIKEADNYIKFFHTSCNITKSDLINLGVSPEKIAAIPLGVDLSLFKPVSLSKKQEVKKKLGIPKDKIVIGSFQKDGVGWNKGLKPKLIKGPDLFVKVLEKLAKSYPIFVLLIGPARGYVENFLTSLRVPFKSVGYLSNFKEISQYYHVLDLYLITSRVEGGPKQILESWASGIPVVSTKVGMVPDISRDGEDTLLAEIEDIDQIVKKAAEIIENQELKKKIIAKARETVQNFSWEKIAERYFNEIYSKLI